MGFEICSHFFYAKNINLDLKLSDATRTHGVACGSRVLNASTYLWFIWVKNLIQANSSPSIHIFHYITYENYTFTVLTYQGPNRNHSAGELFSHMLGENPTLTGNAEIKQVCLYEHHVYWRWLLDSILAIQWAHLFIQSSRIISAYKCFLTIGKYW